MEAPILTHPTSAATSIHEEDWNSNNNNNHNNSNSNQQSHTATNNSINSTQTRRYRDWIKRTQNVIDSRVATKKDAGWNPDLDYHIADIEEDLDRWDRFAQQRENLKTIEIKNEEAMDNGVKALISALSASAVAAITVIYDPDKLAIATLVATLAPICVAIYFLTKSSRTRIQQHQDQVTLCLRQSSIAARRKIKALSNQLHTQWNGPSARVSIEERMNPSSPAIIRHRDQSITNDDTYLERQQSHLTTLSSITDKHPSPPLRQTSSGATLPLSIEHPERHSSKPYDDDMILRKNITLSKPNSYDGLSAKTDSDVRSVADVHIDIHATADATAAANAANIPTRIHTSTSTPESQSRRLNL